MDIKLKRRLIAAIIILALIIIFVPMLFKQHENYAASNVVMTTSAIPPPTPDSQQPKIAPSPPASQSIAQMNRNQIEKIPAIAVPIPSQDDAGSPTIAVASMPNQDEAKSPTIAVSAPSQKAAAPQIITQRMISLPVKVKAKLTNAVIAKPKITQTNIKVVKILPMQTKVNNPPKILAHKSQNTPKKIKTIYLPKMLVHRASAKTKVNAQPNSNTNAYVVQLGAFANSKNANVLIHNLRGKGFTSFGYKKKHADNKIFTYVYVGPLVTHQHAQQIIRQLQKVMKMKGAIVPFDATKI